MGRFLEFISSIGINPNDKEDTVLQKRFLVYQALLMSMGGIMGILALTFNRACSLSSLLNHFSHCVKFNIAHYTKNFKVVQTGEFPRLWVMGLQESIWCTVICKNV